MERDIARSNDNPTNGPSALEENTRTNNINTAVTVTNTAITVINTFVTIVGIYVALRSLRTFVASASDDVHSPTPRIAKAQKKRKAKSS